MLSSTGRCEDFGPQIAYSKARFQIPSPRYAGGKGGGELLPSMYWVDYVCKFVTICSYEFSEQIIRLLVTCRISQWSFLSSILYVLLHFLQSARRVTRVKSPFKPHCVIFSSAKQKKNMRRSWSHSLEVHPLPRITLDPPFGPRWPFGPRSSFGPRSNVSFSISSLYWDAPMTNELLNQTYFISGNWAHNSCTPATKSFQMILSRLLVYIKGLF